ncbi:MAG: triphosphoribosyl-dephospho-CoA synthase [Promethearchaeota archaeon]
MKRTNLNLSINSIDDLMRCIGLASLLELAGWPKPGNVHRTKNFETTRYEHFLVGIIAIQPNFRSFCERIFQLSFDNDNVYKEIRLGLFFKDTVKEMIRWQSGGNVLLGHILILAPLAAAVITCLKTNKTNIIDLKDYLNRIIHESTSDDTIDMYRAIRLCNPGGLGKVKKYDLNDKNALRDIKADNINLHRIFELSKEYDLISSEYSTGFNIILAEGLAYYLNAYTQYRDLNIATVHTFLYLLSLHPDTLIIRKSGLNYAQYVSDSALKILQKGGISSTEGLKLTLQLDNELQEKKGKLNPGTTADLIAGIIFCALVFGLRF